MANSQQSVLEEVGKSTRSSHIKQGHQQCYRHQKKLSSNSPVLRQRIIRLSLPGAHSVARTTSHQSAECIRRGREERKVCTDRHAVPTTHTLHAWKISVGRLSIVPSGTKLEYHIVRYHCHINHDNQQL